MGFGVWGLRLGEGFWSRVVGEFESCQALWCMGVDPEIPRAVPRKKVSKLNPEPLPETLKRVVAYPRILGELAHPSPLNPQHPTIHSEVPTLQPYTLNSLNSLNPLNPEP